MILFRPLGDHLNDAFCPLLRSCLLIHIHLTTFANTGVQLCKPPIISIKPRNLVPRADFRTASCKTGLATPKHFQRSGKLLRRFIRRVKRCKSLLAHLAVESNLLRQNLVHRLRCPQRLLAKPHRILQHATFHLALQHDPIVVCETFAIHVLISGTFPRCHCMYLRP